MSQPARDGERVYVLLQKDMADNQPRLEWVNGPTRWEPSIARSLPDLPPGPVPDHGDQAGGVGSGLPEFGEQPLFVADRPLNAAKPLFEVSNCRRDTLLINDRAKGVFEALDPAAFSFSEVETRLHDGKEGPRHWICDVTRVLAVFDVEASEGAQISHPNPLRFSISPYRENNVFRRQRGAHFFRLLHSPRGIYCDERARSAIHAKPKLRGLVCDFAGTFAPN